MEKEIRSSERVQIKNETRKVEGYAAVFNQESNYLGWIEIIKPGAITEDTIKRSDVFAKFNHDDSKVLARSKYGSGSLMLSVDNIGLKYEFDAPHTQLGDELLEHLGRGDLGNSSFAFTLDPDNKKADRWYKKEGVMYREILEIDRLWDISPVWSPAYDGTICSARFEEIKATSDELERKLNVYQEELENL